MNLNFDDLYQIESGSSQKKIYRFKNNKEKKIVVDFSYETKQFVSFLDVHKFLSNINISIPKIFETDINKKIIIMEDFGDNRFDKLINSIDPKEILIDAINSLIEIQNTQKPIVNKFLKKYDFSSFEKEVAEFADLGGSDQRAEPAFLVPHDHIGDEGCGDEHEEQRQDQVHLHDRDGRFQVDVAATSDGDVVARHRAEGQQEKDDSRDPEYRVAQLVA